MILIKARIVAVLALTFAHALFWFGVLYWALVSAHGRIVRYEAPLRLSTFFAHVRLLTFADVLQACPPILTPLLLAGSAVTMYAVFSTHRSAVKGVLLTFVCAVLCLPAMLGLVSLVAIPFNLAFESLDGEAVSESWFQDAAIAVVFLTAITFLVLYLRDNGPKAEGDAA